MTERALSAREKLQYISEAVLGGRSGGMAAPRVEMTERTLATREVVQISEAVLGAEVGGDGKCSSRMTERALWRRMQLQFISEVV